MLTDFCVGEYKIKRRACVETCIEESVVCRGASPSLSFEGCSYLVGTFYEREGNACMKGIETSSWDAIRARFGYFEKKIKNKKKKTNVHIKKKKKKKKKKVLCVDTTASVNIVHL
eukprot:TRINITY_DN3442_c0_g1_i4.p1 TRINITY_DN3442_c0_g1~~TRINITY_DN3442_c0_g1_i4.p1  ORF type:complete len:115 (+),score=19.24 TRINITY_DN3442_c0_g1_i4:328-672(+)